LEKRKQLFLCDDIPFYFAGKVFGFGELSRTMFRILFHFCLLPFALTFLILPQSHENIFNHEFTRNNEKKENGIRKKEAGDRKKIED
jgi:hypothetical protein